MSDTSRGQGRTLAFFEMKTASVRSEEEKHFQKGGLVMKKMNVVLLAVLILLLSGCGKKTESYFTGEVISIEERSVTVKPIKSDKTNAPKAVTKAEEVHVSLEGFGIKLLPGELTIGDTVRVLFNGDSVKTDPVTIGTAFQIYRVEENGEFTLVSKPIEAGVSDDIAILDEPDVMIVDNGEAAVSLEQGTEEYKKVYEALEKSWKEGLDGEGRLEFVMLEHLDHEPEGLKLTCHYDTHPKKWTMYGEGEGASIQGTAYTLFPYSEEYRNSAVISEGETYLDQAYIVKVGSMEELRTALEQYRLPEP